MCIRDRSDWASSAILVRLQAMRHRSGALDEFVWPEAMARRGMRMHTRGLTFADWGAYNSLFIEPNATDDANDAQGPSSNQTAGTAQSARRSAALDAWDTALLQSFTALVTNHTLPVTFSDVVHANHAIASARLAERSFARKFDPSTEVMRALIDVCGGAKGVTRDPRPAPVNTPTTLGGQLAESIELLYGAQGPSALHSL